MYKKVAYVKCSFGRSDRGYIEHTKTHYFLDYKGDRTCPECGQRGEIAWWVKKMITYIKDKIAGKIPSGKKRSPLWPEVRRQWLEKNPRCEVCLGFDKLEVHHIVPFHKNPALELNPNNLITLCESWRLGINCHLAIGHLGNFRNENFSVIDDAAFWRTKLGKLIK